MAFGQLELDRRLDVLALERVLGVVDDFDLGLLQAAGGELLDDVAGDDQRGERLARANLLDRLGPRLDQDRVDRREELVGVLLAVDLLAAEVEAALAGLGTSLRNATLGFSGARESAKPISSAIAIG